MKKADLKIVIERSNMIFKELKKKHKGLSGYLVFAMPPGMTPFGQCEITTDMVRILKQEKNDKGETEGFPDMVHDSRDKAKAVELIRKLSKLEKVKKESITNEAKEKAASDIEKVTESLYELLDNLEIKEDILVEIRFKELSYDLIFKLQEDPLVSREHTPQTRASIRIVLGTVGELQKKEIMSG